MNSLTTAETIDDSQFSGEAANLEEGVETTQSGQTGEEATASDEVETVDDDSKTGEEATASDEEPSGTADSDHVSKKEHEKRVGKLTQKKYETEQERDFWKNLALSNKQDSSHEDGSEAQQEPQSQELKKPDISEFETDTEYYEALTDYKVQVAMNARDEKVRQNKEAEQQKVAQDKYDQDTTQTIKEGRRSYPDDFDEVALSKDVPYSIPMRRLVMESDKSADLAYFLGKNQNEALRIAQLPSIKAARELGKIEARLSQTTKRTTKAPAPIKPLGGSKEVVETDDDKLSMDEFAKKEEARLKQKGG
jgi:hypothetical protein